ncbi:MAG TPA: hypothetical protein VFO37_09935 [Chitinophagaceae bacterium]|nr:hypothetical protein [Chitinophagaceae bacterium]
MKQTLTYLLLLLYSVSFTRCFGGVNDSIEWKELARDKYTFHYTVADQNIIKKIDSYVQSGLAHIVDYFHHSFTNKFDVYIFPNRTLMDKQWQQEWGDSSFQSQCWMIASGVAHRLDMLSPNGWAKEACDHNGNDSTEIRQVIWHELVHVFHGQYNPDHAFNYIEKLDWLVEGLATYVSGQLVEKRLQRVKQLIKENKTPSTLDNFWKGQERYGLSGSMVNYIDKTFGRGKLFALLKFTNKKDALEFLGLSEEQLIKNWRDSLTL